MPRWHWLTPVLRGFFCFLAEAYLTPAEVCCSFPTMPTAHTNIAARLRHLLKETGWTQADLARVTGADSSTVSRWITDGHKRIDSLYAFRIQDASGICARWILHAEGPMRADEPAGPADPLKAEMLRHAREVERILRESTQHE